MKQPIGATYKQLKDNNIEWVCCSNYSPTSFEKPVWVLRHSSENEWAKDRATLLQEIANLKRDCIHLAKCIDPFDTDEGTYNILRKYYPDFPEKQYG
jgi:hypothetical protein